MRKTTALLSLMVLILGVYYPAIFAEVNSLDDLRMLDSLPAPGTLNILSLFNPTPAGYYRPLTILSYYLDTLANLPQQTMHLVNILIHLVNGLLVFMVGLRVFRENKNQVELAFTSACIFALHPLNVEAVAWISGRTDLLSTVFVLFALLVLYRFIAAESVLWLWLAAGLCLTGALAKETALFFLPPIFILACLGDECVRCTFDQRRWASFLLRASVMVLPFLVTGSAYLVMRLTTVSHVTKNIAATGDQGALASHSSGLLRLLGDLLATYGFYIKKLFFPFPLNFAITDIHQQYQWVGVAIFFLMLCLVIRHINATAVQMILAMLLVMISAFVISRANIAWTPYAERYLYMPSLFFVFAVTDCGNRFSLRYLNQKLAIFAVFTLLVLMAAATTQRALVWQSNLTLYQDTVRKSPNFGCVSNELAIAYTAANRLAEAHQRIEEGKKAGKQGDMVLLYVNQASILGVQKKYKEAYLSLAATHRDKSINLAHIEVIKSYINLMERERIDTKDPARSKKLLTKLLDLHQIYFLRTGDTDHLYRAAQLALAIGQREKAHSFFATTAEKAPQESMYKEFAKKMAKKTEKR